MVFKGADIVDTADRIHAVERAFNIRQGLTMEHDGLPQKTEVKRSPEGKKQRKTHFRLLHTYCQAQGYDPDTGIPLPETMKRLRICKIGTRMTDDCSGNTTFYGVINLCALRP